jgi:hypothetical protein
MSGKIGPGGIPCGPSGKAGPLRVMKGQKDLEKARYDVSLATDACRLNVNRLACFGNYEWTCTAHNGVDCPCWELCRGTDTDDVQGVVVIVGEL